MAETNEFSSLPEPEAIEELTYEQVYNSVLADFQELEPDYELFLESDPVVKVIQAFAYRELLLRVRINESLKANLLCFATGADLDQLAIFYGVTRLSVGEDQEDDEAFRARILQAIKGSSTAGSKEFYKSKALSSSTLVKNVNVVNSSEGVVDIYVLSTEGDGVPDQALLDAVDAVVNDENIRVLTDTVNTLPAEKLDVTVTATVSLRPEAPQSTFDTLAASFTEEFNKQKALGRDITISWIVAKLMATGVYSVSLDLPVTDITVADNQFANLLQVNLTQGPTQE